MRITKNNTQIQINEVGFNIELKADLLLNSLISESTRNLLSKVFNKKLSEYLIIFEEIHNKIKEENLNHNSEYFNSLKENRHETIYEFACLTRDLYSILCVEFDTLYDLNYDVVETIHSIYTYNSVYGFKAQETSNI